MTLPTFAEFEAEQRAAGADEVLERRYAPNAVIDWHSHAFSVRSLVVQGDMQLTVGDEQCHLKTGDRFQLERDVPHVERYGPEGATFWAARRNAV